MTVKIKRSILKRIFIDFEKEEAWLNSMCSKGLALSKISNGHYIFEECESDEYIYRIDFLKQEIINNKEKSAYIDFMGEIDIENIKTKTRSKYFRRKSALGEFNIYSDINSKIKYYQSINFIWNILFFMCILPIWYDSLTLITSIFFDTGTDGYTSEYMRMTIYLDIGLVIIGLFFFRKSLPLRKKIKELKKEQNLFD
ncbi:DUF2812 domain-containing protein [Paraliobacillus sp. JSM ZJ581]|uniref:DUF2812 domain-containing protein n=1 Tax=Paraliobacillus sp. JSM ZJ581 TaxID=3342118 RepID=UPI0035A92A9D